MRFFFRSLETRSSSITSGEQVIIRIVVVKRHASKKHCAILGIELKSSLLRTTFSE
uniref:Uncharacterized protein n=1 Tax=Arundo donax TaxID=35708 RepID=A0A0A9ETK2_ARUDO